MPGFQSAADITQINNDRYLLTGGRWFLEIDSNGNFKKNHNDK